MKEKIKEDLKFLQGWVKKPGKVGAIVPTGKYAARAMAEALPIEIDLPVLELGPGTGVITKELLRRGIAPEKIVSIEYSQEFYDHLVGKYPNVSFIRGDAFNLKETLGKFSDTRFAGVIGAIPLLNVPKEDRIRLIADALARVHGDGPLVQISYGPKPPIGRIPGKFSVEKHARIIRDVPPAGIWTYRKDIQ